VFKDVLCGCQFVNNEEVKDVMHMWLHALPKTFFADGIKKFTDHSNKCVLKPESYVKE
jgi:hypothetical protein